MTKHQSPAALDRAATLEAFLEAAAARVAEAEPLLVALEAGCEGDVADGPDAGSGSMRADPAQAEALQATARLVHAGAALLGLGSMAQLARALSNAAAMLARGSLAPCRSVVEVFMRGFTRLGELARDPQAAASAEVGAEKAALTGLVASILSDEDRETLGRRVPLGTEDDRELFSVPELELREARRGGGRVHILVLRARRDILDSGQGLLEALETFDASGRVLDVAVGEGFFQSLTAGDEARLHVLYGTILEPDLAARMLRLPVEQVLAVDSQILGSCQGDDPAPCDEDAGPPKPACPMPGELDALAAEFDRLVARERGVAIDLDAPLDDAPADAPANAPAPAPEPQAAQAEPYEGHEAAEDRFLEELANEMAQDLEEVPMHAAHTSTPDTGPAVAMAQGGVLRIEGEATIERAAALREAVLNALEAAAEAGEGLALDLGGVEAADLTFVQVLVAAQRQAHTRGVALGGHGAASPALQECLRRGGISAESLRGGDLLGGLFGDLVGNG